MQIQFHGHSCFSIIANDQTHLLIDPFITGNATAIIQATSLQPDVILLTHGHSDHFGDTALLSQQHQPLIIAPFELASYCEAIGLAPTHGMQIGGGYPFPFGYIKMTPALHSSSVTTDDGEVIYTGNPCGFLLTIDGKTIYHAGDTGLSQEIAFIGQLQTIDVALLPIGGNYTMDIDDAVKAARLLKPKIVVPMHYNTMSIIKQNPHLFAHQLENLGIDCAILAPEEFLSI